MNASVSYKSNRLPPKLLRTVARARITARVVIVGVNACPGAKPKGAETLCVIVTIPRNSSKAYLRGMLRICVCIPAPLFSEIICPAPGSCARKVKNTGATPEADTATVFPASVTIVSTTPSAGDAVTVSSAKVAVAPPVTATVTASCSVNTRARASSTTKSVR